MINQSSLIYLDLGDRAKKNAAKQRKSKVYSTLFLIFFTILFTIIGLVLPAYYYSSDMTFGLTHACTSTSNCISYSQFTSLIAAHDINHLYAGVVVFIIGLIFAFAASVTLLASLKNMQPLTMQDPSLKRVRASAILLSFTVLLNMIAGMVILPSLSAIIGDILHNDNAKAGKGISAFLIGFATILQIVATVLIVMINFKSIREAKKVLVQARSTVVKGMNRLSMDFKTIKKMSSMEWNRVKTPEPLHEVKVPETQMDSSTFGNK
jgi:MFS family permease